MEQLCNINTWQKSQILCLLRKLLTQFLTRTCNTNGSSHEKGVVGVVVVVGVFPSERPSAPPLTIPAIIMSWSASSCFLFSSFSASSSCLSMPFTSLSRSVTSAKVLSASALVLVAF